MQELKECPFCGEAPTVCHNHEGLVLIRCSNYGCPVFCSTGSYRKEADAVEAWNARVDE